MKRFTDEQGRAWVATALEEDTPRHHGRWYLVIRPEGGEGEPVMLAEVRWQSRHTAERTLRSMSDFELQRRLRMASRRHDTPGAQRDAFGQWERGGPGTMGGTPVG
ncbi:MAG TPA: hypothetical protein VMM83_03800 [Longimicrobiales bacterium]|nr:hypothetical protein [Longimicrobiales bacterium]